MFAHKYCAKDCHNALSRVIDASYIAK